MRKPRIAVTMGDPAGVGPEICLQLLKNEAVLQQCVPIVFGDAGVLSRVARKLGWNASHRTLGRADWVTAVRDSDAPAVLDLNAIEAPSIQPGIVSGETGRASYQYIETAIDAALAGHVDAVATAPIHKEALRSAGVSYPGHTEIFTERTRAPRSCMMLTSDVITCSFVTGHVGYRDVPRLLSLARIQDVIELSADAMRRIRGREPRLLVCGLNPHAGEHGLFGEGEEEQIIAPAVATARARGIQVDGPLPPDTVFLPERRRTIDCFVCMYHDQGHIPLKALAFDVAVNITLGLPIIRTSVDHGTACDIAWQGKAEVTSLIQAVNLATRLASEPSPASTSSAVANAVAAVS